MASLVQLRTLTDSYEAKNGSDFRFWQVESLLNQAADLLDRCAAMRQYLRSLQEKRTELILRNDWINAEQELEVDRIRTGYYRKDERFFGGAEAERAALWGALVGAQTAADIWFSQAYTELDRAVARNNAWAARHSEDVSRVLRLELKNTAEAEALRYEKYLTLRANAINAWQNEIFLNAEQTKTYLDDQIDAALTDIEADFADAYDRAAVAAEGLGKIYGYTAILPMRSDISYSSMSLLDSTTLWVRKALRDLSAQLQGEQIFTMRLSLASVIGGDFKDFQDHLRSKGSASAKFRVEAASVPTHRYVRLRGLAIVGIQLAGVVRAAVKLPRAAISVQHKSGNIPIERELDQSQLPACIVGRVEDLLSMRPPEMAGRNALFNASPFGVQGESGAWSIDIESISGVVTCDDLHLELELAGLPI